MRYAFDIEADGLLPNSYRNGELMTALTKVHCVCMVDLDDPDAKVLRFHDDSSIERDGTLDSALFFLETADEVWAHSALGYDIPAIKHVYPWWGTTATVRDTLVMSHLIFPWIGQRDWNRKDYPRRLVGHHSLEAWGYRLDHLKGDYGKDDHHAWDRFSQEMLDYCVEDVLVLRDLVRYIERQAWNERSTDLEHSFAVSARRQMENGVGFDMDGARALTEELLLARAGVADELTEALGDRTIEWVTPKKQLKRSRTEPVDPSSRKQVAETLIKRYGWEPTEWTQGGQPKLDERTITEMNPEQVPIRDSLLRWYLVEKRLGQLSEGGHAWLKEARETDLGWRIFGYVNHNGARTGRSTHSRPNLAQVPAAGSPWGEECRALFVPRDGWDMVGADLERIEAKILAHYLYPYDKGRFADRVQAGDFHEENRASAGFTKRSTAKTVLYAVMYGAGDMRVGQTVALSEGGVGSRSVGKRAKAAILGAIPGMARLIRDVEKALTKGYLVGLDRRRLRPAKKGAAFNTLMQGGAAVVMKEATVIRDRELDGAGLEWAPMLHVHDEYQIECAPACTVDAADILTRAMEEAGESLGLRVPISGESKIGSSWAETH